LENIFPMVGKFHPIFPMIGKIFRAFSNDWKNVSVLWWIAAMGVGAMGVMGHPCLLHGAAGR
jgi:hypothetical protein